jgi:hypothetical protein
MTEENTFTETEVNKMLGDQKANIRLDGIETTIKDLDCKMADHMNNEKNDTQNVMKAIEQSGKERRECEIKLKTELHAMDSDHHEKFVKKTDLKNYAFIIIFAVTCTTGFITWLGTQSTNKTSVDKIAEAVAKKIGK